MISPREVNPEAIGVEAYEGGGASDDEIQVISHRGLATSGEVAGFSTGGGVGQIREGLWNNNTHRRWEVVFLAPSSVSLSDRHGFIVLHLKSRWTTIRDAEGDILAGRYLNEDEFPREGRILQMNGFRLLVRKQSDLGAPLKDSVNVFTPPVHFGGKFWVLAEQDDEWDGEHCVEKAEVLTPVAPSPPTPAPSTALLRSARYGATLSLRR